MCLQFIVNNILIIFDTLVASTTPTTHYLVEWAPVHLFFVLLCISLGLYISAKDFPHIYKGRNLRKTPPTVAREGRRTLILILISRCEESETNRNIGIDGST